MSGESFEKIPAGVYKATFKGIFPLRNDEVRYDADGRPMPPACEWRLEIVSGPLRGRHATRITSKEPTRGNACGKLLTGLLGRPLEVGESADPAAYIGKAYTIVVGVGNNPDKTQVMQLLPADADEAPPAPVPAPVPAPAPLANGTPAPAASSNDKKWSLFVGLGHPVVTLTHTELQRRLTDMMVGPPEAREGLKMVRVAHAGKQDWENPTKHGFEVDVIF
jgi:hypothetical protein